MGRASFCDPSRVETTDSVCLLTGDVASLMVGSTSVTAFRFLFEQNGGTMTWDAAKQRVIAKDKDREIILTVGSKTATVNRKEEMMEMAAFLLSGRTMVPVRFFEKTMAARVVWLVANGYASPGEVLGLTFTRKAAGQLLRRVRSRLARLAGTGIVAGGLDTADEPATVSTYHAFAGTLLRSGAIRLLIVGGWSYFILTGSISTIWPMFGIANQLLACTALCVGTTIILREAKKKIYALTTLLPLAFVGTTTLAAGFISVRSVYIPQIFVDETRTKGIVNAGVTILLMSCVVMVMIGSALRWWGLARAPRPNEALAS